MKINCRLIATICCVFISLQLYSQDSTVLNNKLTLQYASKAGAKAEELNQKLDKKSQSKCEAYQRIAVVVSHVPYKSLCKIPAASIPVDL